MAIGPLTEEEMRREEALQAIGVPSDPRATQPKSIQEQTLTEPDRFDIGSPVTEAQKEALRKIQQQRTTQPDPFTLPGTQEDDSEDVPAMKPFDITGADGSLKTGFGEGPTMDSEPLETPSIPSATPAPKSPLEGLTAAFEQEEKATEALGLLGQEEATAMESLLQQKSDIIAESNAKVQNILDQSATEIKQAQDEIDSQIKEANEQKYEGFWQSKSTGEQILGALSVALGAYAQGISGGKVPNTALSVVNKAMEDDFNQFKVNSNKKLQLINQSRASLAAKQQATNKEILRQETYKIGQLSQIESKLLEISNRFKGQRSGEQAGILAAQVAQRKEAALNQLNQQIEANQIAKAQLAMKQVTEANKAKAVLDKEVRAAERKLGEEYRRNPETKKTRVAQTSLNAMKRAPLSSAGDVTLLFNFMKAQDPNSTVRESEFELGKNTGGIIERVQNIIPGFTVGQLLTTEQRQQIIEAAQQSVNAQLETQQAVDKEFRDIAERQGFDVTKIFGEVAPETRTVNGITYRKVPGGWKKVAE
jgi:hypothetical protein